MTLQFESLIWLAIIGVNAQQSTTIRRQCFWALSSPYDVSRAASYGCWLIMRCAYGVPAYMTHVPVSLGLSDNPVSLGSNGQIRAQ